MQCGEGAGGTDPFPRCALGSGRSVLPRQALGREDRALGWPLPLRPAAHRAPLPEPCSALTKPGGLAPAWGPGKQGSGFSSVGEGEGAWSGLKASGPLPGTSAASLGTQQAQLENSN